MKKFSIQTNFSLMKKQNVKIIKYYTENLWKIDKNLEFDPFL